MIMMKIVLPSKALTYLHFYFLQLILDKLKLFNHDILKSK